jgi:hypothetical protein
VYPNPTTGTFTLNAPGEGIFSLISLDGRAIDTHKVTEGDNQLNIPQGTSAGIYVGKYSGSDGSTFEVKIVYRP